MLRTDSTDCADFSQGLEHRRATDAIKEIRRLIHLLAFHGDTVGIGFRQWTPQHIVVPVDGTGFIAVQMRSLASVSD